MEDVLQKGGIWHSLVQNIPYIIMIVDRQGKILYINHTVPGINPKETPGKKLHDYIEPSYHAVMTKALKSVFGAGEPSSYVIRGMGPHGASSWYESMAFPIRDHEKIIAASILTHDITLHKQAEEQLKESERKFRVITERSVDGIFALNNEGYYTFFSPAVRRIAGYEPCEVMGKHFLDFINPDDIPAAAAAFDSLTEKGIIEALELRIKKKDGSLAYVEINASPIIREGVIKGIQGIIRDISSRKKTEEILHRQSILNTALLDAVTESIFLVDTQLRIISVNATGAQRLGKNPQDLIGTDGQSWIPGGVFRNRKKIIDKVIQTGEPQHLQDKKGAHWYDAHIYPIKDKEGKVDKIAVFARDITPKKEQATLLQKSEQKYRAIFEHSPEGIVLLDPQGNLIDINGRLYDWLDYRREEVIGKHLRDQSLFSTETKDALMKRFHKRMQKKKILPYEVELIARDGHAFTGMLQGTLLYDEKGDIMGDLVLISDISLRKALEKKIFEQEKLVALGRIAAMVSHELNTPLTTISLAVELLSPQVPQKLMQEITTIKSEVAHASDIITRILGFARTDDLRYSPLDVGHLVTQAIETLKKQNDATGVVFTLPQPFSLPLQGDQYRLREVFINILKNALEAADPDKKTHTITVKGHIIDGTVLISIQDNGMGIEEKSVEKITDAFYTTKPLAEGTGLGLTIAQAIIQQHGGTLSLTSTPRQGTTVTVTLPQKK